MATDSIGWANLHVASVFICLANANRILCSSASALGMKQSGDVSVHSALAFRDVVGGNSWMDEFHSIAAEFESISFHASSTK